jgi:hypothetical protein
MMVHVAVTVKCPDNSGEKELTKKLPGTMTVQKLKGLLQRLYKVDTSEQKLSYLDNRVSRQAMSLYATPHNTSMIGISKCIIVFREITQMIWVCPLNKDQ